MIRLIISLVAISIIFFIIIHWTAVCITHWHIHWAFDSTIFKDHFLYLFIIFIWNNLCFLNMFHRLKIFICFSISIWIIFLQHRTFPWHQICHSTYVLATILNIIRKGIIINHIVLRKIKFLFRHKWCFQCRKCSKSPTCSVFSLVFYFSNLIIFNITISLRQIWISRCCIRKTCRITFAVPLITIIQIFAKNLCWNINGIVYLLRSITYFVIIFIKFNILLTKI